MTELEITYPFESENFELVLHEVCDRTGWARFKADGFQSCILRDPPNRAAVNLADNIEVRPTPGDNGGQSWVSSVGQHVLEMADPGEKSLCPPSLEASVVGGGIWQLIVDVEDKIEAFLLRRQGWRFGVAEEENSNGRRSPRADKPC